MKLESRQGPARMACSFILRKVEIKKRDMIRLAFYKLTWLQCAGQIALGHRRGQKELKGSQLSGHCNNSGAS